MLPFQQSGLSPSGARSSQAKFFSVAEIDMLSRALYAFFDRPEGQTLFEMLSQPEQKVLKTIMKQVKERNDQLQETDNDSFKNIDQMAKIILARMLQANSDILLIVRRVIAVLNGSHSPHSSLNGRTPSPPAMGNSTSAQQLPPACGARQLSKLKRFLTTLQQFGSDISPEIGERVRSLVLGLVVRIQLLFMWFLLLMSWDKYVGYFIVWNHNILTDYKI